MSGFFHSQQHEYTELGGGVRRKITGHTPELMLVEVHFDAGAVGEPHAHEAHDQIAYVVAGSFEVSLEGEVRRISKGDAFVAEKGMLHGVVALEPGSVLLDTFSPAREDFL